MKILNRFYLLMLVTSGVFLVGGQNNLNYWQQRVNYKMDVVMDVRSNSYSGTQNLIYNNNSQDDLSVVFYHLYYNAFQPGSEMDVRSNTISDPDTRVDNRISKLKKEDYGFINVLSLTQENNPVNFKVVGTILEVKLAVPLKSGDSTELKMVFEGQVPPVIRRAGKNSSEEVALSMAQWYPKMAEYDF